MRFSSLATAGVLAMVCVLMLAGCGTAPTGTPAGRSPAQGGPDSRQVVTGTPNEMDAHDAEDHSPGTELSAQDQALADLQKLCPVSGEELGGMGPPVKLVVKGEPVFICCKGCEKKVNADPDKYLAKVAELKKSKPN
jgi:hypothetical protein